MKKGGGPSSDGNQETEFPCHISPNGDQIRVSVDLLGVSEEKIRLDLDGTLVISAEVRRKPYRASLRLPWEARLGTRKFRKGILELTLERSGR